MRSFQEKLLIFTGNSTNLLLQISELNELRERLRKAEQSARKARQSKPRKRTPIERSAHPWWRIADRTIKAGCRLGSPLRWSYPATGWARAADSAWCRRLHHETAEGRAGDTKSKSQSRALADGARHRRFNTDR